MKNFEEIPIVFLDRDGVINEKAKPHEYITKWEDFKFLPDVYNAIHSLNELGYKIFVVTNQRCIARGIATTEEIELLNQKMEENLLMHDCHIDGIYMCPHDYSDNCECRKPKDGLLRMAAKDSMSDKKLIDKSRSWMIGDSDTDIEAGKRFGINTIYITDKKTVLHHDSAGRLHLETESLFDAVNKIKEYQEKKMKVLITGGAGYIGSHTNRLLNEEGFQTVVLDDLSDGHKEAVVAGTFVEGSFGDKELLDKLMTKNNFDAVIHFAAFASVPDSVIRPARYYRNNVTNMQTLLDACVEHDIKYFVFSSSAATFGDPQYVPMDENHPQEPINPYGYTKLIGEHLLADYERAYGIKYCAFRYFCAAGDSKDGIIGEAHDPETHLIPVMLKAMISGKPFKVFGNDYDTRDGSCIRDFIHVLDIAKAHILGLEWIMKNNASNIFNLGSNQGFTVLEMIKALEAVSKKSVPYEISGRRKGDPAVLVASNKKAEEVLGWKAEHSSIEEILKDALNWELNKKY